jgi:hypothetical protein
MAAAGTHNALRCVGTVYPTAALFQHFLLRKETVPRLTPLPHFAPGSPTCEAYNIKIALLRKGTVFKPCEI